MVEGRLAVTVLIVEDSARLRKDIIRVVQEITCFEVVGEASTADEAIEVVKSRRPEVLVVDLQLTMGTGWDVIDAVGHLTRHVIVLTNNDSGLSRAAAAKRDIRGFFDKTTQFDEFLACMTEIANSRRADSGSAS